MITRTSIPEDYKVAECINPNINKWIIYWDYKEGTAMFQTFDHKPSLKETSKTILDWYNSEIDKKILSGFVWNNIPVWLSMENQFNYKAAYDIAIQSGGEILPTFKFGTTEEPVYYKFESFEDLKDFYLKAMTYITQVLSEGWSTKDTINWGAYSEILDET